MIRYPLQDMVFVREHREEKASVAVQTARRVVREAERALAEKEQALAEFSAWRIAEEERLIQSIMRRPVKLGDINDMRLEIATLRERELDYIDQVRKAEGELDRAREALEKARQAHRQAQQDLEKLIEHRTEWQRDQQEESERLADLELEDFIGPKDTDLTPQTFAYELN
jgi:flagellar biosynthesis chaperone FliJ